MVSTWARKDRPVAARATTSRYAATHSLTERKRSHPQPPAFRRRSRAATVLGTAAVPLFEPSAVAQFVRHPVRFCSALRLAACPAVWSLTMSGVGVMVIFARNDAQIKRTLCADRWCKERVEKSWVDLKLRCND